MKTAYRKFLQKISKRNASPLTPTTPRPIQKQAIIVSPGTVNPLLTNLKRNSHEKSMDSPCRVERMGELRRFGGLRRMEGRPSISGLQKYKIRRKRLEHVAEGRRRFV